MCFFLCTFAAQINTRVMNKIISKRFYSENVAEFVVEAPLIARSRKAGHFVMVRVDNHSERTQSKNHYQISIKSHVNCGNCTADFLQDNHSNAVNSRPIDKARRAVL